jgi:hypothetical protein
VYYLILFHTKREWIMSRSQYIYIGNKGMEDILERLPKLDHEVGFKLVESLH